MIQSATRPIERCPEIGYLSLAIWGVAPRLQSSCDFLWKLISAGSSSETVKSLGFPVPNDRPDYPPGRVGGGPNGGA